MADSTAPFPLNRPAALRRIRALSAASGNVLFTAHARQRMKARGITPPQVIGVLAKGQIVEGPALDAKGCWACTMRRFAAGETIAVAVAISGDLLVIVTVYHAEG